MTRDGKQLEGLIAFVESTLLPAGFDVKTNERIYNDEGVQIAEFDIEIRGKVGSTDIAWLIECRDRPGSGPAPGSWIEQLVGRRTRFGFNKVTAVSTTGFATGAADFATAQGIEIREVASLDPEAFRDWIEISHLNQVERRTNLTVGSIGLAADTPKEVLDAALNKIGAITGSDKILRSNKTGELHALANVFLGLVDSNSLFDQVAANAAPFSVAMNVTYTNNDDCFFIDTEHGSARVSVLSLRGELTITEWQIPISVAATYRNVDTGETISQVVAFHTEPVEGRRHALELHRMDNTGETHVILRTLFDSSSK